MCIARLLHQVGRQGRQIHVRRIGRRIGRVQQRERTQDNAVIAGQICHRLRTGAVIEEARARSQHRLPIRRRVGERHARCEVMNRLEVGLPVVTQPQRELKIGLERDLVLDEAPNLVHPEDRAPETRLLREGVWRVRSILCETRKAIGSQPIGFVIPGAAA